MTATEELRRLLDERGEYYKTVGKMTWWGRPIDAQTGKPINVFHNHAQPMGEDRLYVELQLATPEQAIAATLGRETCVNDAPEPYYFACSSCGTCLSWNPNFCPYCGRKVVDE